MFLAKIEIAGGGQREIISRMFFVRNLWIRYYACYSPSCTMDLISGENYPDDRFLCIGIEAVDKFVRQFVAKRCGMLGT